MKRTAAAAVISLVILVFCAQGFADVLHNQPYDGLGSGFASQNETGPGGVGNFATSYDNFSLPGGGTVTGVQWAGVTYNTHYDGFTITFYTNNGGQPGTSVYSQFIAGKAGQTYLGTDNGAPVYSYAVEFTGFAAAAGTEYWISIVADAPLPQWFWATGTGGDGTLVQDFFATGRTVYPLPNGSCNGVTNCDLAFELIGDQGNVPEPASMVLLGTGLLAVARKIRRHV